MLRRFRLSARIWALVGVAAVGMLGMAGGVGVGNMLAERSEQQAAALEQLAGLSADLKIGALQVRRREKDFFLRKDPKYYDEYVRDQKALLAALDKLEGRGETASIRADLDRLKAGLEEHGTLFGKAFELQKSMGFDETRGLQGRLRNSVHDVEARLDKANLDALTVKMLMMRRHEKDYMLRGDAKYIAEHAQRHAEFDKLLATTAMAPAEKQAIATLMNNYARDFGAFATADQDLRKTSLALSAAFARIEPLFEKVNGFVDSRIRQASVERQAARSVQFYALVGFALAIFVVSILVGWVIARSIITPVLSLTGTVARLSEKDLNVAVTGTEAGDEIGAMARAVQVFKDNLIETERLQAEQRAAQERAAEEKQRREEEKRAAEEEKRAAEARAAEDRRKAMLALADSFEAQVGRVVTEVTGAASQMQSTAQTMSATTEQTGRQATAVAAAAEQASSNVQTVASAAEELANSIQEIARQVAQSNAIARNAVEEAKKTDARVQGLAEAAQKIGDVVSLITDIASQTNLLALNATIEAARAGEAGKGFAVVASEVKSLATQTAKATEEIGAQITAIQGATGDAVRAIRGIGATIGEISEIATAIASAVEEQGAATREIAGNVQQAAAGTREVTSNIAGVTQAAGDAGEATRQVLSAANTLVEHGTALNREVDKFLKTVRAG